MDKATLRKFLFAKAIEALESKGWRVDRIPRSGKSSIRSITKNNKTATISIKTSQNAWFAFARNPENTGWATLEDADYVVVSSVDDVYNYTVANVHMIPVDDMKARFDRALIARTNAEYTIDGGRGIWLSLYEKEKDKPVTLVGAGAGLDNKLIIATFPLTETTDETVGEPECIGATADESPLTLAEAKRRLALTYDVNIGDITITISS